MLIKALAGSHFSLPHQPICPMLTMYLPSPVDNWLTNKPLTAGSSLIIISSSLHPSSLYLTGTSKPVVSCTVPGEKLSALILRAAVIQYGQPSKPLYFHLLDLAAICKSNAHPKSRWPNFIKTLVGATKFEN